VTGRERGDAKTCFSAGRAVYVYYFQDIRQGAPQSDCVMLFGGACGLGVRDKVVVGANIPNFIRRSWRNGLVVTAQDYRAVDHRFESRLGLVISGVPPVHPAVVGPA